jgi:hypothetical protein
VRGRQRKAAAHPAYQRWAVAFGAARPRVAVYTGEGASHSWIWYCDLLERLSLFDVGFITETDILGGALRDFDVLLIGGGDTYAMACSLGEHGAREIETFVHSGGQYHGSCAGAYLVLSEVDLEPFTPFSLIEGDMLNVMREPPTPLCLEHKYLAPYGHDWVFHPVYGEVELCAGPAARGLDEFDASGAIAAPLFGGPLLSVQDRSCVLADYAGATDKAAFLWPREKAESLIRGKQAVAVRDLGEGTASASGPHLEHPLFPESNALLASLLVKHWKRRAPLVSGTSGASRARDRVNEENAPLVPDTSGASDQRTCIMEIKRQVSNARIVGFGLEKTQVTWKIGVKVWEPEKIRMFLDVAWDRIPYLEKHAGDGLPAAELEALACGYASVTSLAKTLRIEVESGRDSQAEAQSLLTRLKELTASFLALYFELRLQEQAGQLRSKTGDGAGWQAG